VTDWVHSLANEWGHWMRKSASRDGALQGTLGRIREEGADGAAIREYGQKVPIMDFPKDVGKFHRAWLRLSDPYQSIIFVDYRVRAGVKEKFDVMHMKRSKYYRVRRKALSETARWMAVN